MLNQKQSKVGPFELSSGGLPASGRWDLQGHNRLSSPPTLTSSDCELTLDEEEEADHAHERDDDAGDDEG